jgi:hypothetical protein
MPFFLASDPPPMKRYPRPPSPKSSANRDIGGAFHPASPELQVDVQNAGIGRDAAAKSALTSADLSLYRTYIMCLRTHTTTHGRPSSPWFPPIPPTLRVVTRHQRPTYASA